MVTVKPDGSIEIPYDEAKRFLSDLRKYITREKLKACYVLGVTLQTIRDWWERSFTEVFNDQVMVDINRQNIPKDELRKHLNNIARYIDRRKYPDIVDESVRCLEQLCKDEKRLSKKPRIVDKITGRFYIDKDTFKKIKDLKKTEIEFKNIAMNMKNDIRDKCILLNDPASLDPNDIANAKRRMDEDRIKILDFISDIRDGIGCPGLTIKLL